MRKIYQLESRSYPSENETQFFFRLSLGTRKRKKKQQQKMRSTRLMKTRRHTLFPFYFDTYLFYISFHFAGCKFFDDKLCCCSHWVCVRIFFCVVRIMHIFARFTFYDSYRAQQLLRRRAGRLKSKMPMESLGNFRKFPRRSTTAAT